MGVEEGEEGERLMRSRLPILPKAHRSCEVAIASTRGTDPPLLLLISKAGVSDLSMEMSQEEGREGLGGEKSPSLTNEARTVGMVSGRIEGS